MVDLRASVFLFVGRDSYSKEIAIKELSSSTLDNSSRSLDLKVFRGSHANAREILEHLSTIPFLAPQRLVVVKEFEKLPDEDRKRIVEYAKRPSKTACLVIDSKDESILDEFGQSRRHANVRVFGEPTGHDLAVWIKRFASSRGKKIDARAIESLKETGIQDLSRLSQELDKIASFTGARDTICPSDVEELLGKNLVASAFDLTNAIEENRADKAMKIVSDLLTGGKKHYEIIGLLSWHVKRLLKAKTLQLKGATDTYIANALRINSKYFGRFFKQVKNLKMTAIKSQMRVLLEADLDIKRSRLDPVLALECAIIRLCLGGV